MEKFEYTLRQRAMVYGSYLITDDAERVADVYKTKFEWDLHRATVKRIVENFEESNNFNTRSGRGRETTISENARELLENSLLSKGVSLSKAGMDIEKEGKGKYS